MLVDAFKNSSGRSLWVPAFAGTTPTSVHLLVRVHAPEAFLLDPAVKAVTGDAAPVCAALLHLGDHTGLELGRNRAVGIGAVVDRRELVLVLHGDDRGAAA